MHTCASKIDGRLHYKDWLIKVVFDNKRLIKVKRQTYQSHAR